MQSALPSFCLAFVNEIKNSSNSCEMDIKQEDPLSVDVHSENETESFIKNVTNSDVLLNNDCDMTIKTEVKSENVFPHFTSQNEREFLPDDPVTKIEKCSSDHEPCSKMEIKEEPFWRETETLSVCDHIEDLDLLPVKSARLKKEDVCSYTPELFFNEELGNHKSFHNIRKNSAECASAGKCQNQTIVCSETSEVGKTVNVSSNLKQNNLLEQSNTSKHWFHFKNHRLVHNGKEVSKPEVCEKGLVQLQHLKRHKSIQEVIKPHKCNICNKAFSRLGNLKRHKLFHEAIKPLECNICNKAFPHLDNLKKHKLIHEAIKPHKCKICNKSFTHKSNFKIHILLHEGIKPHKCNICNKAFTLLRNFKIHQLIHEDTKPHKCNVCNKGFTRLQDLKTHKLIHEGKRPHQCNTCNKSFTQLGNFKKHILIHEGIKPHKCDICNKAFTQMQNLKTHKMIHEDIKPHQCNICNKGFTQLSTLKRHKLIHKCNKPQ